MSTAEVVNEPWCFRAACRLKEPTVGQNALHFGLILDLGFSIYRTIDAVLADVRPCGQEYDQIIPTFAANWAENGEPNPLSITTVRWRMGVWYVHVERVELDPEKLMAVSKTSLDDALVEQGLCRRLDA